MIEATQRDIFERLNHLRLVLSFIKQNESTSPLIEDSLEVINLRGLFYVMMYSLVEYSFSRCLYDLINFFKNKKIKKIYIKSLFYSIVSDSDFKRFKYSSNNKNEIKKRIEFLENLFSDGEINIDSHFFSIHSQNVTPEYIELVGKCLCIKELKLNHRDATYLVEITEKRNRVAHGRDSSFAVGRSTRSPELRLRLEAVERIINHLMNTIDLESITFSCIDDGFKTIYCTE